MVRQFRIDRFNGLEVLVCEVYRKHTWSQVEYEAFLAWKSRMDSLMNDDFSQSEFKSELNDFLSGLKSGDDSTFYGLDSPIPEYDFLPAIVLRGVVVDNRIASLQVDYNAAVLPPEIYDAVQRFYGVMDSRHWRDMVSRQIERYGSLFEAADD